MSYSISPPSINRSILKIREVSVNKYCSYSNTRWTLVVTQKAWIDQSNRLAHLHFIFAEWTQPQQAQMLDNVIEIVPGCCRVM